MINILGTIPAYEVNKNDEPIVKPASPKVWMCAAFVHVTKLALIIYSRLHVIKDFYPFVGRK